MLHHAVFHTLMPFETSTASRPYFAGQITSDQKTENIASYIFYEKAMGSLTSNSINKRNFSWVSSRSSAVAQVAVANWWYCQLKLTINANQFKSNVGF